MDRRQPSTIRRDRDFMVLWSGQAASMLGSSMSGLAFPLLTLLLTGSPVLAGLTTTVTLLTQLAFRLPAGAFVDGHPRDRVLLVFNGLGLLTAGSVGIAYALHHLVAVHIFLACAILGAAGAFLLPALSASLRTLVSQEQRPAALAMSNARTHGASIVGPPLGGALFGLNAGLPFFADALSYGAAAVSAVALRDKLPAPATSRGPMRTSIAAGLRYVWRDPTVRGLMLWGALINLAATTVWVVMILRLGTTGTPAGKIGAVEAVSAVAGLAGSAVAARIVARTRTGLVTIVTGAIMAAAFALVALSSSVVWVGGCLALATLLMPVNNVGIGSYVITRVADDMQGRFNAASGFVAEGLAPIGPLLAGAIAQTAGVQWAALLAGVFALASLAPVICTRELLTLGRPHTWQPNLDG